MKTLKEQLTSVNESIKVIDEERDYVCIHDSNMAKKDFLVVDIPMGYIQLMDKSMLEFKYDTQLLIEGENLDEDKISEYFTNNFNGDYLLAVGDEELIKIHFHTNEPWKVLEYCSQLGEIYDIVIEDMDRQARGLKG